MRRAVSAFSALGLVLGSSLGCGEDAPVLFIELRSDLVPGVEFVSVRTALEEPARTTTAAAGIAQDYVAGERVAELAGIPLGPRTVRVSLLDAGSGVVAERTVRIDFERTVGVTVLVTRDCRGMTCGSGMTCVGGRCVSDACHEELRPEECGVRECSLSADCDAAAASCARSRCELGSCLYVADGASCSDSEYCDVDVGCRPRPTSMDAGTSDAGSRDAGEVDGGVSDAGADAGPTLGTRVAASTFHTCSTRPDGHASCWGIATGGTLGEGSTTGVATAARPVSTLTNVVELAAGPYHTCARRATGAVACWGRNTSGQLGDGSRANATTPVDAAISEVTAIAASLDFTCAVSGGAVSCWGANDDGQLGDGSRTLHETPALVSGIDDAVDVALTQTGTCVRRASGVTCFGLGYFGDGVQTSDPTMRATPPLPAGLVDLVAGTDHFCALLSSGELRCWGDNSYGEIGTGPAISPSPQPVPVPPIAEVWAGEARTCARARAGGGMYCWGHDDQGQIGDGMTGDVLVPTRIDVLDVVDTLSLGASHTCFTLGDDVFCFGRNDTGQLGDGTMTRRFAPSMTILD